MYHFALSKDPVLHFIFLQSLLLNILQKYFTFYTIPRDLGKTSQFYLCLIF